MPKGTPDRSYFRQPLIDKPLADIYADINSWTYEIFADEEELYNKIDLTLLLPPLAMGGTTLKGLCYTRAADFLLERFPRMRERFVTIASSMCSAYPWSRNADALFATYQNDDRDSWFRTAFPESASKPLLPLSDADYTHEGWFQPLPIRQKTIDVLVVSRLDDVKNIPLLCRAVKIHCKKHYPVRLTVLAGRAAANWTNLTAEERLVITSMEHELDGRLDDYVTMEAFVAHLFLPHYYSQARVCVLGSLIEGANRSLKESVCCNTPVVCFKDFNRYSRGTTPVFPPGAGIYSEFDAEAMADAIHEVLNSTTDLKPRAAYLERAGRTRMFNLCLDQLSYFKDTLPSYLPGAHHTNKWLETTMRQVYGIGISDWIYAEHKLVHSIGLSNVDTVLRHFCAI